MVTTEGALEVVLKNKTGSGRAGHRRMLAFDIGTTATEFRFACFHVVNQNTNAFDPRIGERPALDRQMPVTRQFPLIDVIGNTVAPVQTAVTDFEAIAGHDLLCQVQQLLLGPAEPFELDERVTQPGIKLERTNVG